MPKEPKHTTHGAPPPPPPPPPPRNRRGGKIVLLLLVIIILLLVIILLLSLAGFGPGAGLLGRFSGDSSQTSQSESVDEGDQQSTVCAEIKVSGSTVIMDGAEISAADAADKAKKTGSDVIVRITDDNATQNAMEELKSALDSVGLAYTIE